MKTRSLAALAAAAIALAPAVPVAGQTPVTSLGLGYPTPPVDARAAALGGVGVGLLGGTFSIRNPADLVEFSEASLSLSASPEGVTVKRTDGPSGTTGRSRFPALRAVVPLGAFAASVGFASRLDQDWRFGLRDTLDISSGRFPFEERRENDGGVSAVDLSLARSVGPLSVGVSYQRLTGSLRQDLLRRFQVPPDSVVLEPPERVIQTGNWSYSGWRVKGGLGVRLGDWLRVSGVYAWSGDLSAERDTVITTRNDPDAPPVVFGMPPSATVGASASPLEDWLVTAGGGWTGWSETDASLQEENARDVYWAGGGLEFSGVSLGSFPLRLRAGGRWAELPFSLPGRAAATEKAVTFGLGADFASGRAAVDLAGELGDRGTLGRTGFEESFRRFTLTATIRQ
jgi:hypothetical protein